MRERVGTCAKKYGFIKTLEEKRGRGGEGGRKHV